ncbi:glutamine-hydrolyzing carbamoyl-phosphate synthase small subunit [Coxiella endosymbiont of Amblyomma americanum]|uniref:glutamine-hydrolyzing carbamoyl-phosphate synthase small subunit n=1 Tax=Coxiella endosymbiont of Amblyomma americanum TaxID=325775 RepID=UPI0000E670B9|nr:glutamine-hydrolyzing carbamoyl-phosphate synthase small subunit [Coxiella endosymbiont of Amblyomma americanum]ABI83665.1 carbamoylphosphate synthase small subunit [Coxiella endosymbiont of Amblyomma americanum]AJC50509.1 carbamoyl phosphate synthase small subunit [Coxiella endosymbiont of Amblyomma americanum]AUJ58844.1 carbamoyl-phosphate synthase small subunit [Coxiella-like endosymbiont of Amblyomma americanum]
MSNVNPLSGRSPAILALADGSVFSGYAIGANGQTTGEVVFHTSLTGYQEILTDPSYIGQIVALTCPHVGNVGINADDQESHRIWVSGLIVRDLSCIVSNWRAERSLEDFLKSEGTIAIAGVDTRRLVRLIREAGTLNGCIISGENEHLDKALERARVYSRLIRKDLTKIASVTSVSTWIEKPVILKNNNNHSDSKHKITQLNNYNVVVYDYGLKRQIVRLLVNYGCSVIIVPARTSTQTVFNLNPDGIVLSNGPGDPMTCRYAITAIKKILERDIPLLGICLGFQLLVLACGGKTEKMKFGHHGANHPVQNILTGRIYITSQNHGFSVDEKRLPSTLKVTHRSLFDGTLQGVAHITKPAIAFQGHPEANPGPKDMQGIFREFITLIKRKLMKK